MIVFQNNISWLEAHPFSVRRELDVHIQLDKCHFTKANNMTVSCAKSHVETVFIVYRLLTYSWNKQSILFLAQVRGASNPPQYQNMPTVPTAQPAIMHPTQEIPPPPAYTKSGQQQQPPVQQQFSTAEFQVIGSSWEWKCEFNRYPDYCPLSFELFVRNRFTRLQMCCVCSLLPFHQ